MKRAWAKILSLIWFLVLVVCALLWIENAILMAFGVVGGTAIAVILTFVAFGELLIWIRE